MRLKPEGILLLLVLIISNFALGAATVTPKPSGSAEVALGFIDLSSIPTGASVYYMANGSKIIVGKTPVTIRQKSGPIEILVELPGYMQYQKQTYIYSSYKQDLLIELKRKPSPTPQVSIPASPTPYDYSCSYEKIEDRIKCRLLMPKDEQAKKAPFIPEECRKLNGSEYGFCVSNYARLKVCNNENSDSQRDVCAYGLIGLVSNISDAKTDCNAIIGNERGDCMAALRNKVYMLTKFRLDVLIAKAEKLAEMGVSVDTTAAFIAGIEAKKAEFIDAKNLERRKQVVWEVKKIWADFKKDAVSQLKEKKG